MLARLTKAKVENARLTSELQVLQATQAPPVAANHGPGAGLSTPAPPAHGASVEHRLAALESAAGDLETVTIGPQTFKSIQDCKTFLHASVPGAVLDACAYDVVSLIHRVGRESSASGAVAREHTASKAGFQTSGSATLFASFQQALPGPFGVSAATANATLNPIPALKDHATWDCQDGVTGLTSRMFQWG
jgi:hypothetical protein